ncbi:hypothetical protein LTR28_003767 [Elasticomyces elasticus]|nr:hypothetical protein LTR28_003767 [Elasticomyces elasticus]
MDSVKDPVDLGLKKIRCVEMHTTGEPTRIVYDGFPSLQGTLLEQRAQAKRDHDCVRARLMLEPRGHSDMYGAVLCPQTELVGSGEAHMGVLFMTNDGFSTMCGHATIALGRFLVDMHDKTVFPKRAKLRHNPDSRTTELNLHTPCGIVAVIVPTVADGSRSDPAKPVSFISVPSFATGVQVEVPLPAEYRWPQLGARTSVLADFAYGGAFYCMVSHAELGFDEALDEAPKVNLHEYSHATERLKSAINANPDLKPLLRHPYSLDLGFLYSIMVVDDSLGVAARGSSGVETGLCFFADQQVDRSPTGGAVAARVALAYAKGARALGQRWTYHSLLSNACGGKGAFVGAPCAEVEIGGAEGIAKRGVRVKIEGQAFYTGFSSFIVETHDFLPQGGFAFRSLAS